VHRPGDEGSAARCSTPRSTRSRPRGLWRLQAIIFPANAASLALHRHAGFRLVGTRERIGLMMHGPHTASWRDTVLLEQRAAAAADADPRSDVEAPQS
jgi:hypothetical protein